jgi:hypothetical protein
MPGPPGSHGQSQPAPRYPTDTNEINAASRSIRHFRNKP